MHELQGFLAEVSDLPYVSLQPLAGAQGELTSILMVKKVFEDTGDDGRTTVLVPSTAHGTNPATASMAGFGAKEAGLDEHGCVDVDELREMVDGSTAALMITNPNACGVYERNIKEIAEGWHEAGAFLYMDGANMNANMGRMRPAEAGVDIMHFNLHKTFSTPHGGGGPGCGAIACSERSEEHTSELQSRQYLVCRLLLEKKILHILTEHRHSHEMHTPLVAGPPHLQPLY